MKKKSKTKTASKIIVDCPNHGEQELLHIVFAGFKLKCGCLWISISGTWTLEDKE